MSSTKNFTSKDGKPGSMSTPAKANSTSMIKSNSSGELSPLATHAVASFDGSNSNGALGFAGGLVGAMARDASQSRSNKPPAGGEGISGKVGNDGRSNTRPPQHPAKTSSSSPLSNKSSGGNSLTKMDFIGSADTVKNLFALPVANDVGVNIALHNLGNGTLLMDAANDGTFVDPTSNNTASRSADPDAGQRLGPGRSRRRRRPRSASGENIFTSVASRALPDSSNSTNGPFGNADDTKAVMSAISQTVNDEIANKPALLTQDGEKEDSSANAMQALAIKSPSEDHNRASALVKPPSQELATPLSTGIAEPPILIQESEPDQQLDAEQSRNDPISGIVVPPPEQYADAVMDPPHQPRQYLNWKFHEMNLVVASDAVICHPSTTAGDDPDCSGLGPKQSLTVKVAEVGDLRSQMKFYQETKRLKADAGVAVASASESGFDGDDGLLPGSDQKQFYPSYAKALLSKDEGAAGQGDSSASAMLTSPLDVARVPSSDIESNIGNAGFVSGRPPSNSEPVSAKQSLPDAFVDSSVPAGSSSSPSSASPAVVTVLDAYMDNVMANVPQLALCLQEKGFISSVKLLQTEDIPTSMLDSATLGLDDSPGCAEDGMSSSGEPLFAPQMVDMNATMLLRFLKANCSRENTTYLLRRGAGETNIQLYDISTLSAQRQKKWVWWLAMMSYRFAIRLGQMSRSFVPEDDRALRRTFRTRERNLLQNALDLLIELEDMDGGRHETIVAAIEEQVAGTFLLSDAHPDDAQPSDEDATTPLPTTTNLQPYENISRDALEKASDHLTNGARKLRPLLESARKAQLEKARATSRRRRPQKEKVTSPPRKGNGKAPSWYDDSDSDTSSSSDEEDMFAKRMSQMASPEIEALSIQLYGLVHKKINVSLRLAENHLKTYRSSSLMQELRETARSISEVVALLTPIGNLDLEGDQSVFLQSIRCQYAWLWEYCGHFARSFASDELWREKGHVAGEDIISLLQEIQNVCCDISANGRDSSLWIGSTSVEIDAAKSVLVTLKTQGIVSLRSPTALVATPTDNLASEDRQDGPRPIEVANSFLRQQSVLKRERRQVLIAASICYGRAAASFLALQANRSDRSDGVEEEKIEDEDPLMYSTDITSRDASILLLLRQRLGDACNEIGKGLLSEIKDTLEKASSSKEQLIATGPFLLSSFFWFNQSLNHFEASNDLRNIALLRCNLCQSCKYRANSRIVLPKLSDNTGNSQATHAEICLQQASEHLEKAHERLGDRDIDPITWDMVSQELAATLLVLGVRRRQSLLGRGATPVIMQSLRLNPGRERGIVQPIEQAIKIYKGLGNGHQVAAANYQLALYYSKVWTCQRDENKTREKLTAAFKCFGAAHEHFASNLRGNEPTFVILSLDFAGLFSSASGQRESTEKALRCCIDTCEAFSPEAIIAASKRQADSLPLRLDDKEWWSKMFSLGEHAEDKVIKLLQDLVKGGVEKSYKEMYRAALTAKMLSKKQGAPDISTSKAAFLADPETCSLPVYSLLKKLEGMIKE